MKTIASGEARGTLYIDVWPREEDWVQGGTSMPRAQAASRLGHVEKLDWCLWCWSELDWRALIIVGEKSVSAGEHKA